MQSDCDLAVAMRRVVRFGGAMRESAKRSELSKVFCKIKCDAYLTS